jgi:hypothetical protein
MEHLLSFSMVRVGLSLVDDLVLECRIITTSYCGGNELVPQICVAWTLCGDDSVYAAGKSSGVLGVCISSLPVVRCSGFQLWGTEVLGMEGNNSRITD